MTALCPHCGQPVRPHAHEDTQVVDAPHLSKPTEPTVRASVTATIEDAPQIAAFFELVADVLRRSPRVRITVEEA